MRALHLFFRLHRPYQLKPLDEIKSGYFGGEADFREANRTEYQPFFALIERNTQKYPNLKLSLSVSGLWLEQAEAWDRELIRRLHKLVKNGHVQLLVEPYDYSLAVFYNRDEFVAQVSKHREKLEQLFGGDLSVVALPELMYNDELAKWAENAGYAGILAGAAENLLGWRSPNGVYEAKDCKKLRVLFQNSRFSRAVMTANPDFAMVEEIEHDNHFSKDTTEKTTLATGTQRQKKMTAADFVQAIAADGRKKPTPETVADAAEAVSSYKRLGRWRFSAQKFQKHLEIEALQGKLINLCFDTGIFAEYASEGVIRFFDDLIGNWLKNRSNHFYNATEVFSKNNPMMQISIPTTVSWRGEFNVESRLGLAKLKDVQSCPPEWLRFKRQVDASRRLYGLRDNILRTDDKELYKDFSRLSALDYLLKMSANVPVLIGQKSTVRTKDGGVSPEQQFYGQFLTMLEDLNRRTLEKMPHPLTLAAGEESKESISDNAASEKPGAKVARSEEKADDFTVQVKRIHRPKATNSTSSAQGDGSVEIPVSRTPSPEAQKVTWGEAVLDDDIEIFDYSAVDFGDEFDDQADDIEFADEVGEVNDEEVTPEMQVLAQKLAEKRAELEQDVDNLAEAELVTEHHNTTKTRKRKKFVIE